MQRLTFSAKYIILGVMALFLGCGGGDGNPVGTGLVNRRDAGSVVRIEGITPVRQFSEFQGFEPTQNGFRPSIRAGELNGIGVTTLVQFTIPTDSLVAFTGGVDLTIEQARILLYRRVEESSGEGTLTLWETLSPWDDLSSFTDTTGTLQTPPSLARIDPSDVIQSGDTTVIDLAPSFVLSKLGLAEGAGDPDTVSIALQAASGGQFLTSWVSSNAFGDDLERRPSIELTVPGPDNVPQKFSFISTTDTYYGSLVASGPEPSALIVGSGIRFWTHMVFSFPESLPVEATINSAILEMDIARVESFPITFSMQVDRLLIDSTTGDSLLVPGLGKTILVGETGTRFEMGPFIVQDWTSERVPNDGLVLRSVGTEDLLTWLVFKNPKLTIVYSLPPGRE